jgi:hypothetical protein
LADQGIFHEDFLVSYMKIGEFLYRSCDPDLWLFHKQMYVQSQLYGNYPGDSSKPVPQAAVSQAKKIFQDEFVVLGELNNEIRKLEADYDSSTGMNQMIINSYLFSYKSIRSNLVYSDMKIAFNLLSNANDAVDEIENSNGKVDLSAFGGPSDFTIENQKQFIKWTGQANDDFDSGVSGLGLTPSDTRTKLKMSTYIMISTDLDDSAYTSAMKSFEKVVNKAGHALAMSGIKNVCASTIALAVPAVIGIVLCAGVAIRKRRNA